MKLWTAEEIQSYAYIIDRSLLSMLDWVNNFLAKPHAELGRKGPVCPFVPRALALSTIRIAVEYTRNADELRCALQAYCEAFLCMEPRTGPDRIFKTVVILLPNIDDELVDLVQYEMKPAFVAKGLMIGEFHSRNAAGGLHNPDFRPLRSPVPALALRFMTKGDIVFLNQPLEPIERREAFMQAYALHGLSGVSL